MHDRHDLPSAPGSGALTQYLQGRQEGARWLEALGYVCGSCCCSHAQSPTLSGFLERCAVLRRCGGHPAQHCAERHRAAPPGHLAAPGAASVASYYLKVVWQVRYPQPMNKSWHSMFFCSNNIKNAPCAHSMCSQAQHQQRIFTNSWHSCIPWGVGGCIVCWKRRLCTWAGAGAAGAAAPGVPGHVCGGQPAGGHARARRRLPGQQRGAGRAVRPC